MQQALAEFMVVYKNDPEVMRNAGLFLRARPLYQAPVPRDQIFERHHDLAMKVEKLADQRRPVCSIYRQIPPQEYRARHSPTDTHSGADENPIFAEWKGGIET